MAPKPHDPHSTQCTHAWGPPDHLTMWIWMHCVQVYASYGQHWFTAESKMGTKPHDLHSAQHTHIWGTTRPLDYAIWMCCGQVYASYRQLWVTTESKMAAKLHDLHSTWCTCAWGTTRPLDHVSLNILQASVSELWAMLSCRRIQDGHQTARLTWHPMHLCGGTTRQLHFTMQMLCAGWVPVVPIHTTAAVCGTAVRSSLGSARLPQWSITQAHASNVYWLAPVSSCCSWQTQGVVGAALNRRRELRVWCTASASRSSAEAASSVLSTSPESWIARVGRGNSSTWQSVAAQQGQVVRGSLPTSISWRCWWRHASFQGSIFRIFSWSRKILNWENKIFLRKFLTRNFPRKS